MNATLNSVDSVSVTTTATYGFGPRGPLTHIERRTPGAAPVYYLVSGRIPEHQVESFDPTLWPFPVWEVGPIIV